MLILKLSAIFYAINAFPANIETQIPEQSILVSNLKEILDSSFTLQSDFASTESIKPTSIGNDSETSTSKMFFRQTLEYKISDIDELKTVLSVEYENSLLSTQEKSIISTVSNIVFGPNQEKNELKFYSAKNLTLQASGYLKNVVSCYSDFLEYAQIEIKNHLTEPNNNVNSTEVSLNTLSNTNDNESIPGNLKIDISNLLSQDDVATADVCEFDFDETFAKELSSLYQELYYSIKKLRQSKGMCLGENFGMCTGNDFDTVDQKNILQVNPKGSKHTESTSPSSVNVPDSSASADTMTKAYSNELLDSFEQKAENLKEPTSIKTNSSILDTVDKKEAIFKKLESETQTKFVAGQHILLKDAIKIKLWMDTIRNAIDHQPKISTQDPDTNTKDTVASKVLDEQEYSPEKTQNTNIVANTKPAKTKLVIDLSKAQHL
ncbi:hypothetical protein BB559_003541 [Furculomyces boomerangus]|uniref:Uncharacterized protein n=1 Tax=Furculomyces boomerangus TaxID=61424 RepID=A0A2T9Y027_9FUNG|nr:hypothetical protein BB559_007040 [Furculomyces boomerangus]PVU85667.1 hypothetical protein BB559_006872 [Furculomyces boomerangus]PVU92916.1 hypothetical protein BB559_003541 [Furculomyces boomerangus]